jgi:putative protease
MPDEVEGKLIGKVIHYFDHIQVAVVALTAPLKVGDAIRIVGGDVDFEQAVDSMEVEHEKIDKAKKGDEVGMKVSEKVRDGYRVYKV